MEKIKNIIISGGLGTIGQTMVDQLLKIGHRVICTDIINLTKKEKKEYEKYSNFFFYRTDITKKNNIKKLINFAKNKFEIIDVVLHCAYPKSKDWIKSKNYLNQESLNKNISDHLGGTIILSKLFIENFLNQKSLGKIILFSSIYGTHVPKFEDYPKNKVYSPVEYAVIKAGIISLTKYFAKYYRKKKIQINCVSPGGIKNSKLKKSFINNYKKHCNSKGLLDSEDLFGLIQFLLSEKSKMINGQNIIIDDGWSL